MLDKQRLRTFLLGGLAGTLAGIIFAPKSGKELRGTIASRAGEARERSRETYFDAQERMQERVSRNRERPPARFGETHALRDEDATDPLPTLEPAAPPEPGPPVEPPPEPSAEAQPGSSPLRDVSWEAPRGGPQGTPRGAAGSTSGEDPEELRRRIQETRSRLRERLEAPGPEGQEDAPRGRDA